MPKVRAAHRDEKRSQILQGAVRAFARKGFARATVAEIARAAGIADGTLYLYFEDKEHLLASLFEENLGRLCQRLERVLAEVPGPAEKLRALVDTHLRLVEENPALASLLLLEAREALGTWKLVRGGSWEKLLRYFNLAGAIIEEGQAAGRFAKGVRPEVMKHALFGAIDQLTLVWLLAQRAERPGAFALRDAGRELSELFLRGLAP